jgi:hypothetical protein
MDRIIIHHYSYGDVRMRLFIRYVHSHMVCEDPNDEAIKEMFRDCASDPAAEYLPVCSNAIDMVEFVGSWRQFPSSSFVFK